MNPNGNPRPKTQHIKQQLKYAENTNIMNILKNTIAIAAALTLASTASAQTDIFISGSNGDRAATNTARAPKPNWPNSCI